MNDGRPLWLLGVAKTLEGRPGGPFGGGLAAYGRHQRSCPGLRTPPKDHAAKAAGGVGTNHPNAGRYTFLNAKNGAFTPGPHGLDAGIVEYCTGKSHIYVARAWAGFVPVSRRSVYSQIEPLYVPVQESSGGLKRSEAEHLVLCDRHVEMARYGNSSHGGSAGGPRAGQSALEMSYSSSSLWNHSMKR